MVQFRTTAQINADAYPRNQLLQTLSADSFRRLRAHLRLVPLRARQSLHVSRTPMKDIYFIENGLVSVSGVSGRDKNVEVWLVGSEGMTGLPVLLHDDEPPLHRIVQVAGAAYRLEADALLSAVNEISEFRKLLLRYAQYVLLHAAQEGLCNANHDVEKRLCRWLLMARDAVGQEELALTHRTLSRLLGVRRATITQCLGVLAEKGSIRMNRGVVTVIDPAKLKQCCCECYGMLRREYSRLALRSHSKRM
jgi:CRP-like cAMP-binding protein